ncbi:MAG: PTS transporter subunit EIIB [Erysipelotrichaceae bacterium]|jgi:phosphotransferase system IIB component|nr:PTS transporter subunit EIIB [Bacilli bacterium]NLV28732.1 PTS transporter subunit EIIB [Erysipelotrichaceae bacterium]
MIYSDLHDDFTNFLRSYAIWICVGLVVIILATLFFMLVLPKIRNRKRKVAAPVADDSEWIDALGGKSNVVDLTSTRSRLTVELKDSSIVNQEKLKALGVSSIIAMSQKLILVIDNQADRVKEKIEKYR